MFRASKKMGTPAGKGPWSQREAGWTLPGLRIPLGS
jgi:hypothetical protein